MPKLQLEESTEGGNDCEQKEKSLVSLVQAVYHPSLLSLSSDFISHKLTKSSHPTKCWACSTPTHCSPSSGLGGFGAATHPQKHSEMAPNITSRLPWASCNFDLRRISSSLKQSQLPLKFFFWSISPLHQIFKELTVLSSLLPDSVWPERLGRGQTQRTSYNNMPLLMQCVAVRDDGVVSRLCTKAESNSGEQNAKRNFFPGINQQPVTNSVCNNFLVYSYNLSDEAIKNHQDFFTFFLIWNWH